MGPCTIGGWSLRGLENLLKSYSKCVPNEYDVLESYMSPDFSMGLVQNIRFLLFFYFNLIFWAVPHTGIVGS